MKNNYPIKYAVMPIDKYARNQDSYVTDAYVVSKCYLLRQIHKYYFDGSAETKYQVFFPYQLNDTESYWYRKDPGVYFGDRLPASTVEVDAIFDTFEEAKKYAEGKNDQLGYELIQKNCYTDYKSLVALKQKHLDMVAAYEELEKHIEANTQDLIINNKPKEQTIIMIEKGKACFFNRSLYQFISNHSKYVVYEVTREEYEAMKQALLEDRFSSEDFPKRYLMSTDPERGIVWLYDNHDASQVNLCLENGILKPVEYNNAYNNANLDDIEVIIYTQETLSDIINSYASHSILSDRKIIQKVYRR